MLKQGENIDYYHTGESRSAPEARWYDYRRYYDYETGTMTADQDYKGCNDGLRSYDRFDDRACNLGGFPMLVKTSITSVGCAIAADLKPTNNNFNYVVCRYAPYDILEEYNNLSDTINPPIDGSGN